MTTGLCSPFLLSGQRPIDAVERARDFLRILVAGAERDDDDVPCGAVDHVVLMHRPTAVGRRQGVRDDEEPSRLRRRTLWTVVMPVAVSGVCHPLAASRLRKPFSRRE